VSAQARSDDRLPKSATETLAIRSVLAMPVYLTEGLEGVILLVARGRDAFHEGDIAVAHLAIGAVRGGLVRPESETVAAIVRDMPEAAALIDAAGTMETASPAGHELFDTDPDLWNLALAAADTARETGARAVAEGASGAEGWQADAFPLGGSGGRALVRVRAGDGDTGGALREFPIAVGQAIEAPLRAVRDYARALGHSAEADPATRERLASNLVDQTGRLGRAVDELLAAHLARLSSDDLVLTEVDLAQVAREGVERARSASPSATISLQADEYVPAVLDEGVMGRAIDALIDSALALENVLVLHAAGDEQAGLIAVDLGRALPTRLRRRLFEPFAISREGGGLGLGFFIARYVALAHGGDMRVSEDGRSVELLLPRHGPG
jgi:signal transduction histidine kinase